MSEKATFLQAVPQKHFGDVNGLIRLSPDKEGDLVQIVFPVQEDNAFSLGILEKRAIFATERSGVWESEQDCP